MIIVSDQYKFIGLFAKENKQNTKKTSKLLINREIYTLNRLA